MQQHHLHDKLKEFGDMLGGRSRTLFCPYPWENPTDLDKAFDGAIVNNLSRVDASYLLEKDGLPIGHFFLCFYLYIWARSTG